MEMDSTPFRVPAGADDAETLNTVDWAGLVARLGAERDLRRELTARFGAAASFSGNAEAELKRAPARITNGSSEGSPHGEPAVNPAALGDSKAEGPITPSQRVETPASGIEARRGQE